MPHQPNPAIQRMRPRSGRTADFLSLEPTIKIFVLIGALFISLPQVAVCGDAIVFRAKVDKVKTNAQKKLLDRKPYLIAKYHLFVFETFEGWVGKETYLSPEANDKTINLDSNQEYLIFADRVDGTLVLPSQSKTMRMGKEAIPIIKAYQDAKEKELEQRIIE